MLRQLRITVCYTAEGVRRISADAARPGALKWRPRARAWGRLRVGSRGLGWRRGASVPHRRPRGRAGSGPVCWICTYVAGSGQARVPPAPRLGRSIEPLCGSRPGERLCLRHPSISRYIAYHRCCFFDIVSRIVRFRGGALYIDRPRGVSPGSLFYGSGSVGRLSR